MFVAMSRFVVANHLEEEVRQAFLARPHLVDTAPGFVRMEVMNPTDNPAEFHLLTYWQDEQSWRDWYHGHHYKEAHKGIPRGLKLLPRETEIRCFHSFAR